VGVPAWLGWVHLEVWAEWEAWEEWEAWAEWEVRPMSLGYLPMRVRECMGIYPCVWGCMY